MSRLAVIIVNYNGGEMLHDCLAAVAVQTRPADRVLVLDNHSTDGSIDRCRAAFPQVEFHQQSANLGFARGNNVAIELAADCDWIALLNPDAFPAPTWLEALTRAAQQDPDTNMFASCMISARDRDRIDGAGDAYRVDGLAWPRYQGDPIARLPRESQDVFTPSAGAGYYRRADVVAAGGFCERFFCYYEDVDLGFRLRLRGGRCRYVPDAVVHHMGSAITGTGSDFSIYHVHRNVVWTYLRNMPAGYVWRYLPAHIAANLTSMVLFIRKGRARAILRAKRDALLGLPATLAERRIVQRERRAEADVIVAAMAPGNLLTSVFNRTFAFLRRRA